MKVHGPAEALPGGWLESRALLCAAWRRSRLGALPLCSPAESESWFGPCVTQQATCTLAEVAQGLQTSKSFTCLGGKRSGRGEQGSPED